MDTVTLMASGPIMTIISRDWVSFKKVVSEIFLFYTLGHFCLYRSWNRMVLWRQLFGICNWNERFLFNLVKNMYDRRQNMSKCKSYLTLWLGKKMMDKRQYWSWIFSKTVVIYLYTSTVYKCVPIQNEILYLMLFSYYVLGFQ